MFLTADMSSRTARTVGSFRKIAEKHTISPIICIARCVIPRTYELTATCMVGVEVQASRFLTVAVEEVAAADC